MVMSEQGLQPTVQIDQGAGGAIEQAPPPTEKPKKQPAPLLTRLLLGVSGVGLVVGFFLPWVELGGVMSLSGLGLMLSSGDAIEQMSGPHQAMLFVVPLSGLVLLGAAIRGYRGIAWAGLVCGFAIFTVGLYTLIRIFLDTTGVGMWVVASAAIICTAVGIVAYRRR
jgi:hypothetical protein